ncbi:hypothetical protein ACR77J_07955 [Tissierella praeacuta]|uniref:ParM/StbA family protein n=1 Tax=Tissierella praeacuta TaxID=43131 RepID=UPI003DA2DA6C
MNIITVDAGKFQTKCLYGNVGLRIRTKMEEVDGNIQVKDNGSFYIKWDNDMYILGDGAKFVDYDISKHKLHHKLAIYSASASLLKENIVNPTNLVVLSPLSLYTNVQAREEFRQFILNNHSVKFELNSEHKNLLINDVTVFAEACGVPISNPDKFKNKTVGLLDIGGLNVNGMIFKNMKPIKGTHFTENLGSLIVMEKIRKELNKEIKGANIQEYQMDNIIKKGYYLADKELSREIIKSLLSDHFKDILQVAKASNWDIKGLDIVVSGGGSIDIGLSSIQSYIPQTQISNDPVWDNCKGGSMVGEMIYG